MNARSLSRQQWKFLYRLHRVIWRESAKVTRDVMIFGSGFALIGGDAKDGIEHIPLAEIYRAAPPME